jgi:putative transposase
VDLFWRAIDSVRENISFELIAHVILPDHFHVILNPGGADFTGIMHRLKMSFGMRYRKCPGTRTGRVWQHRYWDHMIRDNSDMNRHVDYIHFNPVRHGLVKNPLEWNHSSFADYQRKGYYQDDWGTQEEVRIEGDFGE